VTQILVRIVPLPGWDIAPTATEPICRVDEPPDLEQKKRRHFLVPRHRLAPVETWFDPPRHHFFLPVEPVRVLASLEDALGALGACRESITYAASEKLGTGSAAWDSVRFWRPEWRRWLVMKLGMADWRDREMADTLPWEAILRRLIPAIAEPDRYREIMGDLLLHDRGYLRPGLEERAYRRQRLLHDLRYLGVLPPL
jgi:hypothetical protein